MTDEEKLEYIHSTQTAEGFEQTQMIEQAIKYIEQLMMQSNRRPQ